jgi:hypothetical protein
LNSLLTDLEEAWKEDAQENISAEISHLKNDAGTLRLLSTSQQSVFQTVLGCVWNSKFPTPLLCFRTLFKLLNVAFFCKKFLYKVAFKNHIDPILKKIANT